MAHENQNHNDALSEGFAVDSETSATTPVARTPYLPTLLPVAHVEIVSLNCEVTLLRKHISDDAKRMENLSLTVRELESAIIKRDAEIAEKRAMVIHHSNETLNAEARCESLQLNVDVLREKVTRRDETIEEWRGEHADACTNVKYLADRVKSLEADMAGTLDNVSELSRLLEASGRREDRSHETLMGITALAESAALTDAEKVALILRLIA